MLRREVGVAGAVLLGLGSIVGTGVFVSLVLAVELAGDLVVWAVLLAALVALCNGLSSAQLAAAHPVSGGTYEYGYEFLHPTAGFTAGWLFLIAKSASAATAALGIAAYLGQGTGRLVGIGAVVVVTAVVLAGIRRSTQANAIVVTLAITSLVAVVVAAWPEAVARGAPGVDADLPSLLEAAALVFVAFTGYGRIATLGEEVRDPRRTIPIAVVVTLAITAVLYASVAYVESRFVEAADDASTLATIGDVVAGPGLGTAVSVGALAALMGVLLNLILGLSRVALAMGRRGDAPAAFARIDRRGRTPTTAVVGVAVVVASFVLVGDIHTTWSFSALTVLGYYAITNLSALKLPDHLRRFPRAVPLAGLIGCLGLAVFIDPAMWLWGGLLVGAGLAWHRTRVRPTGSVS